MKILAVIPARGGSKGIPRKNVRLLNGKPLITYSINNAKSCELITDIAVTSDDEEIISIAGLNHVSIVERDPELAGDAVTLDPVVYDAVIKMEERNHCKYDVVITLQATSPLLQGTTLKRAIEYFLANDIDSLISAINKPHLSWSSDEHGYFPNYAKRLNRQQLPPNYFETGAFFITKREYVKVNSRLGNKISVFEVPESEAVDIDDASDWIICEHALKKKRIVFRADGYKELGMGHIYHCLTLAYNLTGHEIMFVTKEQFSEGVDKIKNSHMPYTLIKDDEDFLNFLKTWKADIIVNDCLDTSKEYIQRLKLFSGRVITIEDLGEGADYADAVINALYNVELKSGNHFAGERYICLRDEFLINQPKEFSRPVKNVVVLFGGTDPSNLTRRIYDLALKTYKDYPGISFDFITGSGYNSSDNGVVTLEDRKIFVHNNIKRVSDIMRNSDLAFTSQGRTVFELASLGIPSIVLAQNEREQLHTFAQMQNGFLNLGIGNEISDQTIEATFHWLAETEQIRYEMRQLMLKHDLKKGIKHVINIILSEE